MTEQRDSVTAAELAELERQLRFLPYYLCTQAANALRALRRERDDLLKTRDYAQHEALRRDRDEARERHAISQSVAGDMASALDDARAANAKKDAALRGAREFVVRLVGHLKSAQQAVEAIDAALTPASQEAPAPPSPGLREAVIEECAKLAEATDVYEHFRRDMPAEIAERIRALSRPVSEREDGQ